MIDLNYYKEKLIEFEKSYDSSAYLKEKREFLEKFPSKKLPVLSLEEYVLGNPNKNGFCKYLEFNTTNIGKNGGPSNLNGIWTNEKNWPDKFVIMKENKLVEISKEEAEKVFFKLRSDLVNLIKLVEEGNIDKIDDLKIGISPAKVSQIVFLYSEIENEPITSAMAVEEIKNFCKKFEVEFDKKKHVQSNYLLLKKLKSFSIFKDWTPHKISSFLFEYLREKKTSYWAIAPFPSNINKWDEFYKNKEIRIGWDKTGDLSEFDLKEELHRKILTEYKNDNPENWTNSCWNFSHNISIGDYVIAKMGGSKKICGIGKVISNYEFREDYPESKHKIGVDWFINFSKEGKEFSELDKNFAITTVEKLSEDKENFIMDLINNKENLVTKNEKNYSKNTILYGPPGTGKTYTTKEIAVKMIRGDNNA